jgi:hypothetical protein
MILPLLDLAAYAMVAQLHTTAEPSNIIGIQPLPSKLQEHISSAASGSSYNHLPSTCFLPFD